MNCVKSYSQDIVADETVIKSEDLFATKCDVIDTANNSRNFLTNFSIVFGTEMTRKIMK